MTTTILLWWWVSQSTTFTVHPGVIAHYSAIMVCHVGLWQWYDACIMNESCCLQPNKSHCRQSFRKIEVALYQVYPANELELSLTSSQHSTLTVTGYYCCKTHRSISRLWKKDGQAALDLHPHLRPSILRWKSAVDGLKVQPSSRQLAACSFGELHIHSVHVAWPPLHWTPFALSKISLGDNCPLLSNATSLQLPNY